MIQTLVAEIYGPNFEGQRDVARQVKQVFQQTPGVVDVDWYVEDPQPQLTFTVDEEKAALHGISAADVAESLAIAESGKTAGLLHDPTSREPVPVVVEMQRADRSSLEAAR